MTRTFEAKQFGILPVDTFDEISEIPGNAYIPLDTELDTIKFPTLVTYTFRCLDGTTTRVDGSVSRVK